MKEFKKGDKVRFISTKGSGIVTAVNKGIVTVMIEDGFEIPVEASDLVVIENTGSGRNPFIRKNEFKDIEQPAPSKKDTAEGSVDKPVETGAVPESAPDKKESHQPVVAPEKGLYLAFVPENQDVLISGDMDIYLINYSSWQVAYQLMLPHQQKGLISKAAGLMQKGDATCVASLPYSQLKDWSRIRLQTLCIDTKEGRLFDNEVIDLDIKTTKFIHEDNYSTHPFFDELAHIIFVADLTHPPLHGASVPVAEKTDKKERSLLIDRFMTGPAEAEVDLHIEKLRGDNKTMPKEEMMTVQLSFFKQCIESARMKGVKKIVFIHGVGAGLLKKELQDLLNTYPDVRYEDASLLKYGIGATEVRFE